MAININPRGIEIPSNIDSGGWCYEMKGDEEEMIK